MNVSGLSVAIATAILILLYVRFELSFDDFHSNALNIYRISTKVTMQNQVIGHETNTYEGISKVVREDFSDVISATTIELFSPDDTFVHFDDGKDRSAVDEFNGIATDSSFFSVFSFSLLIGNPELVLKEPYTAVVSQAIAKKYFDGSPVGKTVETYDGVDRHHFTITGVAHDVPANSHFNFDLLIHPPEDEINFWNREIGFWDWGGRTYVMLEEGSEPSTLEEALNEVARSKNELKRNKDDYGQTSTFHLQPLTDIHLHSHLSAELEPNGSSVLVYSLIGLAIIIIVIAWINYINLSTAITTERIREIGVRKIIGATRMGLMLQVLAEAVLYNFSAVIIAVLLVHLLVPFFMSFTGIVLPFAAFYGSEVIGSVLVFGVCSTLLSGIYPAYLISSYFPALALKGKRISSGGTVFRKGLVVFQFASATVLVIVTLVAYQQILYMRNKELGINIDRVLIVKAQNFHKETWSDSAGGFVVDSLYLARAAVFKDALRDQALVENASTVSHLPGQLPNWGTEFQAKDIDPEKAVSLKAIGIDYDFISTFRLKLLAGRNFSPEFLSDQGNEGKRAVLLNEIATKLLGYKDPREAIGRHISTYWNADYEVIGVVNSFHQVSLKEDVTPIYFILQPRALSYYAVNLKGEETASAVHGIEHAWETYFPDYPFHYFFLDKYYDRQYQDDKTFSNTLSMFSGLAIFVACMGLFGLTSYSIVQRTKEIGIRKVLGATISGIIGLLAHDYMKIIVVATVIAVPVAYFGATEWLAGYAYRIHLSWWLFIVPFLAVLLIALATISIQTIKVVLKNPTDSLKYE